MLLLDTAYVFNLTVREIWWEYSFRKCFRARSIHV